jgi:hypothetical protein
MLLCSAVLEESLENIKPKRRKKEKKKKTSTRRNNQIRSLKGMRGETKRRHKVEKMFSSRTSRIPASKAIKQKAAHNPESRHGMALQQTFFLSSFISFFYSCLFSSLSIGNIFFKARIIMEFQPTHTHTEGLSAVPLSQTHTHTHERDISSSSSSPPACLF